MSQRQSSPLCLPHLPSRRETTRSHRNQRRPNMAILNCLGEVDRATCLALMGYDSSDMGEVIDLTDTTNQSMNNPDPVVMVYPSEVNIAGMPDLQRNPDGPRTESDDNSVISRERLERTARFILEFEKKYNRRKWGRKPPIMAQIRAASSSPKVICPICKETAEQIRQTRDLCSTWCGHVFCSTCIMDAVKIREVCPTCNHAVIKEKIHPVYL